MCLVIGTRPEAIKLAPVAHAIAARAIQPHLLLTGQHPSLDVAQFGLGSYARTELHCAGETNPHAHVRKVSNAMAPMLPGVADLVVVQGDTSSALGGALASIRASVPLAHVEAGLRTGDPQRPWPEEGYRVRIDRHAHLLFAATEISASNLADESVRGEVHVTGNTGVDSLLPVIEALPPPSVHDRTQPRLLVTCHRRESWLDGLQNIAAALRQLASDGTATIDFVLHPNPHVAHMMTDLLGNQSGIALLQPCTHRELIQRMAESDVILSDSGGVQEEAPSLGVPLLVLRDTTERPEGVYSGNMRLVGTSTDRILLEVRRLLSDPLAYAAMSRRAYPYGDGRAAPRIARIIDAWLANRRVVSDESFTVSQALPPTQSDASRQGR